MAMKRTRKSSEAEDLLDEETTFSIHAKGNHNHSYSSLGFINEDEDAGDVERQPKLKRNHLASMTSLHTIINTNISDEFDGDNNKKIRLKNKRQQTKAKSMFNSIWDKITEHSALLSKLKMIVLIIYCVSMVIIFSMRDEREENWSQLVISNTTSNRFVCNSDSNVDSASSFLRLEIKGPFRDIKDHPSYSLIDNKFIEIHVFDGVTHNAGSSVGTWTLVSQRAISNTTIHPQVNELANVFELPRAYRKDQVTFYVETNDAVANSFAFNCVQLDESYRYAILLSIVLLTFVYTLIIFELIHRSLAAGLGALGGLALVGLVMNERPTLETVVGWVEWETILLISGMMMIVAVFCETGLFDLIAVRLFHYSGTRIWVMIGSLCLLAATLSAFLDNVTTILLLTPITIRLCEVMKLEPKNIIIGIVIFSNIGGCSTAIGDPPNVIITAHHDISSAGVDFSTFTIHMLAGVIIIYAISFLQFRFVMGSGENFMLDMESEFDDLKTEINLWQKTYQSITPVTKGEKIVKTLLKEKVSQLESLLSRSVTQTKSQHMQSMREKSQDMVENYKITNVELLVKCAIIFSITLLLFFLNPFIDSIHLTIGWISVLSALVLLAASSNNSDQEDMAKDSHLNGIGFEALMHKIEWSTLLFFAGLFIFMKCIEELGLLKYLGDQMSTLIKSCNQEDRLVIALLILTILSAVISSLIDNIPFTTAMIPIIVQLSEQADLPLKPLVFALALGSCLGGNGTLVGASCNLVAAGIAEQHGHKITFNSFFRISFPIMCTSILVALIYIVVTTCYIEWY